MNELSRRIGKFDSPESLLRAYESLESEFTKRSQKLKDITRENETLKKDSESQEKYESYAKNALLREEFVKENVLNREDIQRQVIEQYLTVLNNQGSAKVLSGGVGKSALTPPARPSDLTEAKRLADIILNS